MVNRPGKLLLTAAAIRLSVIPLLVLVTLLVTGDGVHAAGVFNPVSTSVYCAEGTGTVDTQQITVGCTPDISQGSHADIVSTFDIGLGPDGIAGTGDDTGDYNFGGVVNFSPTVPDDAAIPVGAILGVLGSQPTLGLVNNTCSNSQLKVPFTFMKGSTDITDVTYPQPFGSDNDLAIMSGDTPPYDGVADVNPPPAATQYPSFLNAIFDPDWSDIGPDKIPGNADDINGPAPPIKPVFRAVGTTSISAAGRLWVILQLVIFDKGTKLPALPAFSPAYGYPSVVVLQTSSAAGSATPPAPSAVTDFCSPLKTANVSYGITKDNPATSANEGGVDVRTLPPTGYNIFGYAYGSSQRDADGDGYENSLDPCPFDADTVWDPRYAGPLPRPGDGDKFAGTDSPDGIPDTCDPTPLVASAAPPANQPTDHDGDGFLNTGDNCPLIANGKAEADTPGVGLQKDSDKDANGEEVGDGIGDACDPNPGTPDGADIPCIKESRATVGGDPNTVFSACLTALPAISDADNDSIRDENDLCPNTPAGATVDIVGCSPAETPTGGFTNPGTTTTGGTGGGGVGGPVTGVGSLSPVGGSVPAWAAIAAGLGAAGVIASIGTLAPRLIKRRRDS